MLFRSPVAQGKRGITAGFYAAKTHNLIPATDCALQPPIFAEIVAFICQYATKHHISAYDETTGRGLLRHIYLRCGAGTGEVLVTLVVRTSNLDGGYDLAAALHERFPEVVGVLLNVNSDDTNVVLGSRYITLWGKDTLRDTLCGLEFTIAPAAFWQVNHDGAEILYRLAAKEAALTGEETLLDLYCGIGSIGLSMADRVKELIGIELVALNRPRLAELADAVRRAIKNYFEMLQGADPEELDEADAEMLPLLPTYCQLSGGQVVYDDEKPCQWLVLQYACETNAFDENG